MSHIGNNKSLLTRVRKIRGQANALEKSLTQETECIAVLQQISAIRGAVNGLMTVVLEDHIREHVGNDELSRQERASEVDGLIRILKSYLK